MEGDRLGLHLVILDVHLVATEDDRNLVPAHAHQVTMPVRHFGIRFSCGHIEHYDCTLAYS